MPSPATLAARFNFSARPCGSENELDLAMGAAIFELREGAAGSMERGRQTNPRYDHAASHQRRQAAGENASDHLCGRHGFFGVAPFSGVSLTSSAKAPLSSREI